MPSRINVFIVSAPSGAGKSSLIHLLLTQIPSLLFSISHTTRLPREGETNGVEYFFINDQEFESMIERNEFLEWARVHGHYYGTSKAMLEQAEKQGKDLLLDVDYQGAQEVRGTIPEAVSFFILPPSREDLRQRLITRGKDTSQQIQRRLQDAQKEIAHLKDYNFVFINDDLNATFEQIAKIIHGEQVPIQNLGDRIAAILKSFDLPS